MRGSRRLSHYDHDMMTKMHQKTREDARILSKTLWFILMGLFSLLMTIMTK